MKLRYIFSIFAVIIIVMAFLVYNNGGRFDSDCLEPIAINYCESLNLTYHSHEAMKAYGICCWREDYNPRQGGYEADCFKFLEEETASCWEKWRSND